MNNEYVDGVLAEIRQELAVMNDRVGKVPPYQAAQDESGRQGSRYVGPDAEESLVEWVAKGGAMKTAQRVAGGVGIGGTMTKALAVGTNSSGGYLVAPQVAEDVMRMIRARSVISRLGPRVVPVARTLAVTSISTSATAYYVAENAAIPISEPTFAQTPLLTPKELTALVPVSNRLLSDAAISPAVEQVLRQDLAEIMALRQDLAFIQGTGTGGEPLGLVNVPGLTPAPSLGANGRAPTFDDLKDMMGALRAQNAPFERPGWIFHPRTIGTLEKLKDTTGRYLSDAGVLTFDRTGGGGTLLGFKFATTTQIPANLTTGSSTDTSYIAFSSDWDEAWIGENESLSIEASVDATYSPDGGTTWVSAWQTARRSSAPSLSTTLHCGGPRSSP